MEWTRIAHEDYENLGNMYGLFDFPVQRYMFHVAKYVNGVMETPKTVEEQGPIYEIVPEVKQREAVDFSTRICFATPPGSSTSHFSAGRFKRAKRYGNLRTRYSTVMLGTRTLWEVGGCRGSPGQCRLPGYELFR